jgi:pilus assembly protein FimV
VETKLDLASAYLDMGDQVGARSLLDEVLREGNATQKERAGAFLKKLG